MRCSLARLAENQQIRRGGWDKTGPEAVTSTVEHLLYQRRDAVADRMSFDGRRRREDFAHANRVEELERSKVPAKSPSHHAIDVVDGVRDVGRDPCRVDE